MKDEEIAMHRNEIEIEGGRRLYSYEFFDRDGKILFPEPPGKAAAADASEEGTTVQHRTGNLNSDQPEDRKE
jgi:hypothetical protein